MSKHCTCSNDDVNLENDNEIIRMTKEAGRRHEFSVMQSFVERMAENNKSKVNCYKSYIIWVVVVLLGVLAYVWAIVCAFIH